MAFCICHSEIDGHLGERRKTRKLNYNMESTDLSLSIEVLDGNIDDLEEALAPVLKGAVSEIAGKLPLLDKAQFYVLLAYSIESILFCTAKPLLQ